MGRVVEMRGALGVEGGGDIDSDSSFAIDLVDTSSEEGSQGGPSANPVVGADWDDDDFENDPSWECTPEYYEAKKQHMAEHKRVGR